MPAAENHLIESLPRMDRLALLEFCEPVQSLLADVLHEETTPTRHVYCPVNALVSLIRPVDAHPGLEIGMVGTQLAFGIFVSPLRALAQGRRLTDGPRFEHAAAAHPVPLRLFADAEADHFGREPALSPKAVM